MKRERVWKYTCDHCGKSGLSASAMTQHETTCTANPLRTCRFCVANNGGNDHQHEVAVLRAVLPEPDRARMIFATPNPGEDFMSHAYIERERIVAEYRDALTAQVDAAIPALRDAADGCPACMLAAIRQSGLQGVTSWRYKEEKKAVWAVINEANRE